MGTRLITGLLILLGFFGCWQPKNPASNLPDENLTYYELEMANGVFGIPHIYKVLSIEGMIEELSKIQIQSPDISSALHYYRTLESQKSKTTIFVDSLNWDNQISASKMQHVPISRATAQQAMAGLDDQLSKARFPDGVEYKRLEGKYFPG